MFNPIHSHRIITKLFRHCVLTGLALSLPLASEVSHAQSHIDESKVEQTLWVTPEGNDSEAGTTEATAFSTIQRALKSAEGKATKIVLGDGTYRQYADITKGDSLLIIEAKNTGKAVINGADVFAAWKPSKVDGVLEHEWPYKWGVGTELGWWGSVPVNRRREMIYVNDKRMVQRTAGDGLGTAPIGEGNAPDPEGGAVELTDLRPGDFTVDEAAGKVYAMPETGVDFAKAEVEMPVRGYDPNGYPWIPAFSRGLLRVRDYSNLVLRGIVVKRAATYMKFGAAIEIIGSEEVESAEELPENLLVDGITVIENNAIGMEITNYRDVTVQDSVFNDNGERGAGMVQVGVERKKDPKATEIAPRNFLWQDCQFNGNNWRMVGTWGDMNDSAGFKSFGQSADNSTFLRCQFSNNLANGYWQDYAGSNVVIDSCLIENNRGTGAAGYGILNEMTRGPLTVKNSVIRNNSNVGFISSGSPNVSLLNNTIYHNNFTPGAPNNYFCQEIRINSDVHRGSEDFPFSLEGWVLMGNTFASLGGEIDGHAVSGHVTEINGDNFPSGLTAQAEFAANVISDKNVWSKNPADAHGDKILFSLDATEKMPNINLTTWQQQKNLHGQQDLNSTFVYPIDLSGVKDPTKKTP